MAAHEGAFSYGRFYRWRWLIARILEIEGRKEFAIEAAITREQAGGLVLSMSAYQKIR